MDAISRSGDQVAKGIRGVVAAEAFIVGIAFQDIGGLVGVMLEEWQGIEQAGATLMDEERGPDAGCGSPRRRRISAQP